MGKNERYFASTKYNMARALNVLADMIEESGGEVDRHSDEVVIYARGYDEQIYRIEDQIERIQRAVKYEFEENEGKYHEARENALSILGKELDEFKQKKADAPIVKSRFVSLICDLWIRFKLDGYVYEISFDDNPFFPDRYCKAKENGDVRHRYLDEIECGNKFYYTNDMFCPVASEETIKNVARGIFNFLKNTKESEEY